MARSGLIIVDKPGGMTSHDVVARVRRIAGTRKVGHAGTLDPMATGILVIGIERATKLLGYLMGHDKTYSATIRLGESTNTDDADGDRTGVTDAFSISDAQIAASLAQHVGSISQVPSSVSAIKVGGRRAYDLAREGKEVELNSREVQIHLIEVSQIQRPGAVVDVDIVVRCGPGTYIRAIARDIGAHLGVGGHLTALRRTASGTFDERNALTLEKLAELADPVAISLDEAIARTFAVRAISAAEGRELSFGRGLPAATTDTPAADVHAAIDPDGHAVALIDAQGKPVVVFRPA